MKKIILIWVFSCYLDGFSQAPDTVRASLLRTVGHMRVAHQYNGYAVCVYGNVIGYLDDQKRPFKPQIKIWGCQIHQNPILNCGDAKPYGIKIIKNNK